MLREFVSLNLLLPSCTIRLVSSVFSTIFDRTKGLIDFMVTVLCFSPRILLMVLRLLRTEE